LNFIEKGKRVAFHKPEGHLRRGTKAFLTLLHKEKIHCFSGKKGERKQGRAERRRQEKKSMFKKQHRDLLQKTSLLLRKWGSPKEGRSSLP